VIETEWLSCTDPEPMLDLLRDKASDRKLRLFGVACCRRIRDYLTDPKARNALELAERATDGSDIAGKLRRASADLKDIMDRLQRTFGEFGFVYDHQWFPTHAVKYLFDERGLAPVSRIRCIPDVVTRFVRESSISDYQERDELAERTVLSRFLRDVCGNPFRRVGFDSVWRTPTTVALAASIYEDRAFDRMPILADAMEEAGCDSADILLHCRGPSPHVRGCWVVDLLLGKE
jgi:hypothetical protein